MATTRTLKNDALGKIGLIVRDGATVVVRDTRGARFGIGWLARRLAAREAAVLLALEREPGMPTLIGFDGGVLERSYLPGEPIHTAQPRSREYFVRALRLLRALHRRGIAHNDLAKEGNWLNGPGEQPGIIDFQLAYRSRARGRLFRGLAREDLRHLMKHKRTYFPQGLTARQRALLAHPVIATRAWRALVKPVYLLVTRRLLRWPERYGSGERHV